MNSHRGALAGNRQPLVIPKAAGWLSLAAAIGLALWLGWPGSPPTAEDALVAQRPMQTQTPAPDAAPAPVATLLNASDVVWGGTAPHDRAGRSLQAGTRLAPGHYTLQAGVVELVFDKGAAVIVEAPARFELVDGNTGRLEQGQLVARIPESADGFRLATPTATAVTRRGEFGVRVSHADQTEMLVFDGTITAEHRGPAGEPGGPALLGRGQLARASHTSLELLNEQTTLDGRRFARGWQSALRPIDLSPDVYFVYATPASLDEYGLISENKTALVPESMGYLLPSKLPVELRVRGGEQFVANEWLVAGESLDAGTRVDSYLLHISRDPSSQGVVRREGRITFDRPIVGLVFATQSLNATDPTLGLPGMRYASHMPGRGMTGESPQYPDRLVVSEDGRTLEFSIAIAWFDELRILVASPPSGDEGTRPQ